MTAVLSGCCDYEALRMAGWRHMDPCRISQSRRPTDTGENGSEAFHINVGGVWASGMLFRGLSRGYQSLLRHFGYTE